MRGVKVLEGYFPALDWDGGRDFSVRCKSQVVGYAQIVAG